MCDASHGMEDRRIPDSQITVSSVFTGGTYNYHGATNARLNHPAEFNGTSASGAWVAAVDDLYQWIQVNLGVLKMVSGIVLQGREDESQWVTKYQVNYSLDAISWMWVKDANQQIVSHCPNL